MNAGFVWFTHSTDNTTEAVAFYEKLLGWKAADGPPGMTMFAGESGPFAGPELAGTLGAGLLRRFRLAVHLDARRVAFLPLAL